MYNSRSNQNYTYMMTQLVDYYFTSKTRVSDHDLPSIASRKAKIKFKIVCMYRHLRVADEDNSRGQIRPMMSYSESPVVLDAPTLHVKVEDLGLREESEIKRLLFSFGITGDVVSEIIDEIISNLKSAGRRRISMAVGVGVFRSEIYRDGRSFADSLRRIKRSIPASESAIEALEKVKWESGSGECGICMDEFLGESEVSRMPCSHLYHPNRISKWLNLNHTCPICRFPVQHDSSYWS